MRRVLEYHDWAARTWEARADATNEGRVDFKEGYRAYALRQAAVRKAMKAFCAKAWRSVIAYVNLCTETSVHLLGSDDTIVPPMSPAPARHATPSLVPPPSNVSLATILSTFSAPSINSLPALEVPTSAACQRAPTSMLSSSSTTSLPALGSIPSSSTTSLPSLASMPNSSVKSFTQAERSLEDAMEEMSEFLGIEDEN